jgi:hypothetical protein
MQSTHQQILSKIYGHGRGWAFSGKDFVTSASRAAADQALRRLCAGGTIRRVCRGIYDYPRQSRALDLQAPPDVDQVAQALARNRGWRLQASGPWAANLLGLSTQVPATAVYLTDGKRLRLKAGNAVIEFRPVSLKDLQTGTEGLVIQALKAIGEARCDRQVISKLRKRLSEAERRKLLRNRYVTGWVYGVVKTVCGPQEPGT